MSQRNSISQRYLRPRWPFLTQNAQGTLLIDNISVQSLAEKFGTPLYVLVEREIRERLRRFKQAFSYKKLRPQYAAKCNSNLEILKIVREEGFELDASSIGEIILGMLADFTPDQITFTNLYKSEQDILFATKIGVYALTVDSIEELRRCVKVGEQLKQQVRVFLRMNPGITFGKYTTKKQQYGIPWTVAKKAINEALNSPYISLVGLHFHGAYVTDPKIYCIAAEKLLKFASYAYQRGAPLESLDLGGGFPVEYKDKQEFTPEDVSKILLPKLEKLYKEYGLPELNLIFEPGKFIVNTAGIGLVKVVSKKYLGQKKKVVTDGSTYAMLPDPMIYHCYYDILPATKMNQPRIRTFDICGCTCDCIDIIGANRNLPRLKENDLLAIMDCGAYSNVMASNFNTLRRPPMVMIKESGEIKLIRRRDRYSEMFAPELDVLKIADPYELKKFYDLFRINIGSYWNPEQKEAVVKKAG
ncbi:diaminopimelate decarboxylase [Candidatus Woesearchaeota archaeon]|nr:diaminopimelate decarboxylase [Candidatus Woesearchaeota archaeon]